MNYIDRIAHRVCAIAENEMLDLNGSYAPLYRMYAVLVLAKGAETTSRDVHDAWSAWCAGVDPDHRSLKPFDDLTVEVQALDNKYRDAIIETAASL
jgi:hypothetical protein